MRKADPGEQQQFEDRQHGYDQLEPGRGPDTIYIKACKQHVRGDRDNGLRHLWEKNVEIRPDGCGDSGGGENELDDLGHARDEAGLLIQAPRRIIEDAARTRYGAGELGIGKSERNIKDDDHPRGDCESQGTSFRQAQVPAEVLARDDIADAEPPLTSNGAQGTAAAAKVQAGVLTGCDRMGCDIP